MMPSAAQPVPPAAPGPPPPYPVGGAPPYPGGPGAQPPSGPQPPAAASRRRGPALLFVPLGLVVLLLIGSGTAWGVSSLVSGAGDGMEIAWTVPFPGAESVPDGRGENPGDRMFGSWLTDTAVVRAQHDGVIAYRLTDGRLVWGTPVPAGTSLCTSSWAPDGGMVAVVYGPPDRCDRLAGINLADGRIVWEAKIPARVREGDDEREAPTVATAGGVAVVKVLDGEVLGLGLTDGGRRWSRKPSEAFCMLRGMDAGPTTVVVGESCEGETVLGLDPATGKQRWRTTLTKEERADWVLSVSPTVLVNDNLEDPRLLVLSDQGRIVQRIPKTIAGAEADQDTTEGYPYLVHGDTLYMKMRHSSGEVDRDHIIAYDLKTGERRWGSSGHEGEATMIRADDQGLVVLETTVLDPARLVRVDGTTGKVIPIAEVPERLGDLSGDEAVVHERDGTLVVLAQRRTDANRAIAVLRQPA